MPGHKERLRRLKLKRRVRRIVRKYPDMRAKPDHRTRKYEDRMRRKADKEKKKQQKREQQQQQQPHAAAGIEMAHETKQHDDTVPHDDK